MTHLSLATMANLPGRQRQLSPQSTKRKIMKLSAPDDSQTNFLLKVTRYWTQQDLKTLEEAAASYLFDLITDASFQKQQPISCRFSPCLLLW